MDRNLEVERAIRQRDIDAIVALIFDGDQPRVRRGFSTETELWDFKRGCPRPHKSLDEQIGWSNLAADVLAFHNKRGGVLFLGIRDDSFKFCGIKHRLDSKSFNDQLRKYLSDRIWIEFHRVFIQSDQSYLGIAVVPPRGPLLERFRSDAPSETGPRFRREESAIREGDSTKILRKDDIEAITRQTTVPFRLIS